MAKTLNKKELIKRYTKALFEQASESKQLDIIEIDLNQINQVIIDYKDLLKIVSSPLSHENKQKQIIKHVFSKIKITGTSLNFLYILAKHKRFNLLPEIIENFHDYYSKSKLEITAEVTSVTSLNMEQQDSISDALEKKLNKKVRIKYLIDKDIIGGLVIKLGSKMLDNSLVSKLQKIKQLSKEAIAKI
jgi:F-type H+-transporting ATPase subunit delta